MDKRSLLFMLCISLAFFGVQSWFGSQKSEQAAAHQTAFIEKQKKAKELLQTEMASRLLPHDALPLADLFSDPSGEQKLGVALVYGSHFFTLKTEPPLPSTVYVRKNEKLEPVTCSNDGLNGKAGAPLVYSFQGALPLNLPPLPLDHPADLQLVSLGDTCQITLGEQRGESLQFSYDFLNTAAIALFKDQGHYLPVGVYDPFTKKVTALREFDKLQQTVVQSQSVSLTPAPKDEEFYVIENEYQQLVFSTLGGSLAEINLPLHSPKNTSSLIKEIDIDRRILAESPQNAHFPLYPHFRFTDGKTELVKEGSLGGYYPLLRRSQISSAGKANYLAPPEYYALNIISDDGDFAKMNYRVVRFEKNLIQFKGTSGKRSIVKTFSIPQDRNGPYCLQLEIEIEGSAEGLWLSSGVPDVEMVGGAYAPLLRYQTTQKGSSDVETIDLPKTLFTKEGIRPNWISNCNGFLGLILDPLTPIGEGYRTAEVNGTLFPTRLSLIDQAYRLYPPEKYPGYLTYLPLKKGESTFRIFAGPFDDALLKELDALYDDPLQNYNPDYASAQSIQGWFSFISQPFAKFLFLLMQLFYTICRSWALSIVLLTIALRAMMYPLNTWSIRSTLKMQQIAPKVKAVQEKYKKDPKRAQAEVVQLYKESGVNPFMGCLPMFLQMPFLIGMFYLLKSSFPLRGAIFIPGWIDDLAAPDVLFTWGQPLWFVGNEFHLLPVLMGAAMFLQQKMSASAKPKSATLELSDTEKQQKMMGNVMSLLFMVMFYSFPSGLNIYFMFSTLLGVVQQWWIMRNMKAKPLIDRAS